MFHCHNVLNDLTMFWMILTGTVYVFSVLRSHVWGAGVMSAPSDGQSFTDEECRGWAGGDGHYCWPGPARSVMNKTALQSDRSIEIMLFIHKSKHRCVVTEALYCLQHSYLWCLWWAQLPRYLSQTMFTPWISAGQVFGLAESSADTNTGEDTTSRVFVDPHIIAESFVLT